MRRKGFTTIELMIVVIIIATLVLSVPAILLTAISRPTSP